MVVSGAVAVAAVAVGTAKPSEKTWCPLPSVLRKEAVTADSGAFKPAGMKSERLGSGVPEAAAAGEAPDISSDDRPGKRG